MLFSVIVPIYKVENYLKQCVESILSQTFVDFELILVDDGSPDNCGKICDEYAKKDSRIVVVHKANGGLSDARNAGIRLGQGDYIIFVDSDDFYATDDVFSQIANEAKTSNADLIQFHRKWYYEDTGICIEKKYTYSINCEKLSPAEVIRELTERKMIYFAAYQNVIKRSFLLKNNLFFTVGIKSEDIDWGFRVFSSLPKISLMPNAFYMYRAKREGSITYSIDYKHLNDYCELLKRVFSLIANSHREIYLPLMSHALYHVAICSALVYQVSLSKNEKQSIQKCLAELCKNRMGIYNIDSRAKLAGIVYRILGYRGMAIFLGVYLNKRDSRQHSFETVESKLYVNHLER